MCKKNYMNFIRQNAVQLIRKQTELLIITKLLIIIK